MSARCEVSDAVDVVERLCKWITPEPGTIQIRKNVTRAGAVVEVGARKNEYGRLIGRNGATYRAIAGIADACSGGCVMFEVCRVEGEVDENGRGWEIDKKAADELAGIVSKIVTLVDPGSGAKAVIVTGGKACMCAVEVRRKTDAVEKVLQDIEQVMRVIARARGMMFKLAVREKSHGQDEQSVAGGKGVVRARAGG